ncbi:MAG: hypothetical protein J5746_08715 [Victivallales bacterium]|nr:hypothetical protein [Victivallales bacterium]
MMKIITGLLPSGVLPRNDAGVSEQNVTGTCRSDGAISAIIRDENEKVILQLPNCGHAAHGKFTANLNGIPCGGPYSVELSNGCEAVTVRDVLVGEVWILAGQSNMQGTGFITGKRLNTEPSIRAYYMDDKWAMAQEPIGRVELSRHAAHLRLLNPPVTSRARRNPDGTGAEPGLPFALERWRGTGVPQGLIACAHGGTSIAMWNPATKGEGYGSLYGAMISRVIRNGGRVTGMLWYQGCSDATPERMITFEKATLDFFRAVRRDLKAPRLPIVQAQIARQLSFNETGEYAWTAIREAQRLMPHHLRGLLTVPTIDLVLDDAIHLDEESQFILGRRMAEAMATLLHEPNSLQPPIELNRAVLRYDRAHGLHELHIHYRNVVGSLQSTGRPNGFVIGEEARPLAYRIILDGSQVILKCTQSILSFAYGYGQNPYCNITDEAGRSLPACAMQPVAYPFTRSDYARHAQLSEPIYGCKLAEITAAQARRLSFAPAQNNPPFSIFHDRLAHITENGVRFFRTRYFAEDELDLSLALGYDGNVKVFVDGNPIYLDEHARNPIIPASHLVLQHWKHGEHEVLIAQNMNHGCTWGISLALEKPTAANARLPQEKPNTQ